MKNKAKKVYIHPILPNKNKLKFTLINSKGHENQYKKHFQPKKITTETKNMKYTTAKMRLKRRKKLYST